MRIGSLALAAVAPTLLLAAGPGPVPAGKLGKTHKIDQYGYSIRVPKDWVAVPAQPGETHIVGQWGPDLEKTMKKGDRTTQRCGLYIVRFARRGTVTGPKDAKAEKAEEAKRSKDPAKSRSLNEFIDLAFHNATDRYSPKPVSVGRGKSKLTGNQFEFTSQDSFICAATFEKDEWEWGIFYAAHEAYYEKEWQKVYLQSIQTFRLFEPKGDVYSATVDKSKLSPEERRKVIKAGIAGSPGWWAHDTDNYVILTNSQEKGFIKEIGKDIETIREKLYEKLFPPTKEIDVVCIVRVFSDEMEYYQYGGPPGSAGYWTPVKEELVLYADAFGTSKAKGEEESKAVAYHEAFHQYIFYAIGDVSPHSWFNEGHGDFFAGHVIRGSRVTAKPFEWRTKYLKAHLQQDKGLIPVQSLVRLPQSEYYTNPGLKYSEGWALIYYLRNVTKNERWQAIPDRYFEYLRDNIAVFKKTKPDEDDTSGEKVEGIPGVKKSSFADAQKVEEILRAAVDAGFEGVDYDELDEAFQKWVKSLF